MVAMELPIWFVDAFTSRRFCGNPAAVVPLEQWLPEELMLAIARENNLSETAYFVRTGSIYEIRWFTPKVEVPLCGHGTLASGAVGVPEDPVTGSAHTRLAPYWAARLGRNTLFARQVSARGGEIWCELNGDRVRIAGDTTLYLEGTIYI